MEHIFIPSSYFTCSHNQASTLPLRHYILSRIYSKHSISIMRSAAAILVATTAFLTAPAVALFDCNADQHAFPVTPGKFVVHYTSIRDSNYDDDAWVRITLRNYSHSPIPLTHYHPSLTVHLLDPHLQAQRPEQMGQRPSTRHPMRRRASRHFLHIADLAQPRFQGDEWERMRLVQ